jgi:hypothetical protein
VSNTARRSYYSVDFGVDDGQAEEYNYASQAKAIESNNNDAVTEEALPVEPTPILSRISGAASPPPKPASPEPAADQN